MDDEALQGGNELERLWDGLLSREPEQIQLAFSRLTSGEQADVRAHLLRMVTDPGWHPEQRASALAALKSLGFADEGG